MLTKRRPIRARVRYSRPLSRAIDFQQLRREVKFVSNAALIMRDAGVIDHDPELAGVAALSVMNSSSRR